MPDTVPPTVRSRIMATIHSRDTKPELLVRSALHKAGFRFRLHPRNLPGRPDLVLPRYRTAVFVHGCFWHGHDCPRGRRPSSNVEFWATKLCRNISRDQIAQAALRSLRWRVKVIWQCELPSQTNILIRQLRRARRSSQLATPK